MQAQRDHIHKYIVSLSYDLLTYWYLFMGCSMTCWKQIWTMMALMNPQITMFIFELNPVETAD